MHCRSIIIDPRKRLEEASDPVSGGGEAPLLLPFAGSSAAFIIIISNSYKDAVTISFVIDKTIPDERLRFSRVAKGVTINRCGTRCTRLDSSHAGTKGVRLCRDKGAHGLSIKMVACDVDAGSAIISKNAIIVRARLGP